MDAGTVSPTLDTATTVSQQQNWQLAKEMAIDFGMSDSVLWNVTRSGYRMPSAANLSQASLSGSNLTLEDDLDFDLDLDLDLDLAMVNSSNHSLMELEDPTIRIAEEFIISASCLYFLIFVIGFIGNLMFCYIVISSPAMKTVTNYFLLNLAITDLLISIFCTLNQAILLLTGSFPFGSAVCYLLVLIQPTAILSSSFTLVVITIERYISILHPLKPRMKTSHSKIIIVLMWVVAALCSSPDVYLAQYIWDHGYHCTVNPEGSTWAKIYHAAVLLIQYVTPVLIMLYCYSMMAFTIWRRREFNQNGLDSQLEQRRVQMIRSKKKMVKMLIVVVSLYSFAYFPLNIVWLILGPVAEKAENSGSGLGHEFAYIHMTFLFLALSHVCYNPLIYFWMNIRIRYGFLDLFGKIPFIRKCFPNVTWDSPFSRRETLSRYAGASVYKRNSKLVKFKNPDSVRKTVQTFKDDPAIEMRELCQAEPLLGMVVDKQKNARIHKISCASATTVLSDLDVNVKTSNGGSLKMKRSNSANGENSISTATESGQDITITFNMSRIAEEEHDGME